METLKNVARHSGTWGNGHYEATVQDNGNVVITTILDNANQSYTVALTRDEWRRLAGWVEWAQGGKELIKKLQSWATPAGVATSFFVTGATLTFTAVYSSKPYFWGVGLMMIGILGVAFCLYKWSNK